MKSKFKIDQRVYSNHLGAGTVERVIEGTSKTTFAYSVLFDNTPPKEYNNGNNPCIQFEGTLKDLEDPYIKGQVDLIKKIASEVIEITDNDNDDNVVVNIMNLLRNLKPIDQNK